MPTFSDPVGMSVTEDAERVAALHALRLMDTPPEQRFDRITRLAQQLFGVRSVGVNLVDADRQFTKAAVGDLAVGDRPRAASLCTYTVQGDDLFEIPDARDDEAWATHPAVAGPDAVRFYAGVPLRAPGGERVGALCLLDPAPRHLTPAEQEMLTGLGELVERELASSADLEQGREVQRRLLPQHPPDLPGWQVGGTCVQMNAVGGDFFDWQLIGEELQLVLCDVMGKGLSAALLAAGVRVVTRGAARYKSLAGTVARVAEDLSADLEDTGSFLTAFACRVSPADGALEYIDAGHGLAFILSPDGDHRRLVSDGLPIGALPGAEWTSQRDRVAPGECLAVVSDGLFDLHPDVDALMDALAAIVHLPEPLSDLAARAAQLAGGRAGDDITVLLLRRDA